MCVQLRVLRILRVLRALGRLKQLRQIINGILSSIVPLMQVFVIVTVDYFCMWLLQQVSVCEKFSMA